MNSPARKPLIVIGTPCFKGVGPETLEDWFRFAFHLGRRYPEFNFEVAIKAKSEQFRARNAIVDAAMQVNADYLLMLDDDMVIDTDGTTGPTSAYDFLRKLIAHKVDIVGALYFQRQGECAPVAMMKAGHGYRFLRNDELVGGLQRVDVVGGGCMLVNMRVFGRIHRPYFEPEFAYGTDIQLCRKAAEEGFEVWLDSSIELGHVREERVVVTSRTRHQFMGDQVPGETRKFVAENIFARLVADAEEYTGFSQDEFGWRGNKFMAAHASFDGPDHEWYKLYGKERVARQVWYNKDHAGKRQMTEYILTAVDHTRKLDVLDFGCGIGIPAFTLAEKGHRVTAMDLAGTETLRFLQWRKEKHHVNLSIVPLDGPPPVYGEYDVIIAMDCLEHIEEWRNTLAILAAKLRPGGVLFSNNAILDDDTHPEHYHIDNGEFVRRCAENGLLPLNQIAYIKKEVREVAHGR